MCNLYAAAQQKSSKLLILLVLGQVLINTPNHVETRVKFGARGCSSKAEQQFPKPIIPVAKHQRQLYAAKQTLLISPYSRLLAESVNSPSSP